jgi:hypothetical protein
MFMIGVFIAGMYLSWSFGKYYHKRPKLYCFPTNDWIKPDVEPIPATLKEYLATDGYRVYHCNDICYNKAGKPCLPSYRNNVEIYAWLPMPRAPLVTDETSYKADPRYFH